VGQAEPSVEEFTKIFSTYKSPEFEVDTIHLIQSQLTAQKARYKILSSHKLGLLVKSP
jgi:2'-5' RNA ligase